MAEIDLIPEDYRTWLSQQAIFHKYSAVFAALIAVVIATAFALGQAAAQAEARASQLQTENAISQRQQEQLEQLEKQQAEYERQWSLLRSLRAGAAVEDIFNIIDRSIDGKSLWFIDWKFSRAGVVVDGQQRGVETGYFIIVSTDGQGISDDKWQVETHMTIHGQARDHQALSTFVRALFEQPGIKDVNVKKSALTDYANGRVVDFDLTVIMNSAFRDT